jgi:glycosyltransferase involved in cell wall biosynthesis
MKIIIVDGSDRSNDCFKYVSSLTNNINTRVFHVDKNIGHGRGLCIGIEKAETQYALIFDSDIEILKSPVQAMMDMMESGTYGVGYTEKTAFDGHEWGCNPIHKMQGWMRYLHPYFCLIDLTEYKKYKPFIHHGAPAVNTMLDIHRRGLGDRVIKEFPGLGHSSGKGWVWEGKPREFIRHDTKGTRAFRVSKGLSEIEGTWEKVDEIDKNNNITCVTCTGDRPLAFSLCRKWMRAQTINPSQWVVVDDGEHPISDVKSDNIDYIRREPKGDDPKHTMILNLKEAFKMVQGNSVFFIEDDEY